MVRTQPAEVPVPDWTIHRADLAELEDDHPAFGSADVVVHAAVDYRSASQSVEMVGRVIAACRRNGVRRLVYISSHNAGFNRPGRYSRGKLAGEELVRGSGLTWVILRPTLLYGGSGGPFLSSLIRLARPTRVIPVLGGGRSLIQPAHRDDAAAVTTAALSDLDDRTVAIGGSEPISMRDLALTIRRCLGPALVIPLPIAPLRVPALVLPTMADKLRELDENKTLSPAELASLERLLGRRPRSLAADLPSIVARGGTRRRAGTGSAGVTSSDQTR